MKIKKKPADNVILFEDVPVGIVFKDEAGDIYMKLDSCYKNNPTRLFNAVGLGDGRLAFFNDPNEEVEILENAVLTY